MSAIDRFVEHFAQANPFLSGQVSDPSGEAVDVPSIHDRPFRDLTGLAETARRERRGVGAVVWGEAGVGKSHLLGRLFRWAAEKNAEGIDRAICLFLHNVQASPERLPRYVLKCVIARLTRGRSRALHGTPLYWLLVRSIKQALEGYALDGELPSAADARYALLRMADRIAAVHPNLGADARSVFEVFYRFFLAAYRKRRLEGDERPASLAVRWLSGEELDRDEAEQLGLDLAGDVGELAALPDEQAMQTVLVALAELAAHRGQGFVLCFDQADNLTHEQVRALAQFQHTLIDHARNLLVVTSGVKSRLLELHQAGVIPPSAWDRIAQEELTLARIRPHEARQLIEARLKRALEAFIDVPEVRERVRADGLFPLGRAWLDRRLSDLVEVRPRDAVHWARDRWRLQQQRLDQRGGPQWLAEWPGDDAVGQAGPGPVAPALSDEDLVRAVDDKVARRIREQIVWRETDPAGLPADAGHLCGLVETLLWHAAETAGVEDVRRVPPQVGGHRSTYDLTVAFAAGPAEERRRAGLTFVLTPNAVQASHALRRLAADVSGPDLVVLVSEERMPLRLGPKGEEYFEALRARGPARFRHVELSTAQYAELDALVATCGDARSGDLELDLPGGQARPVSEPEVVAAYRRQGRLAGHPLLAAVLGLPVGHAICLAQAFTPGNTAGPNPVLAP